jgi:hypothetical protein
MKKTLFFGLALMLGVSAGVSAGPGDNGSGLSGCCRTLQQECVLNYGTAACANVYNNCMAARRCILP